MRTLLLMTVLACAVDAQQVVWTDVEALGVEGKGWADTKAYYDRLPARAEGKVRDPVWGLSRHSAGLCVRFVTDAPELHARWALTSSRLAMAHMPATGVSGVDLYLKTEGGWRWVAAPRPGKQLMNARLLSGLTASRRTWMLYLPLYNGVSKVEIGVPKGHVVKSAPARPVGRRKPIVFYGTSITQGGCASRAGMCHVAILGRRLDRPVINLGFSGNGRMDPEVVELMCELDPAVYVIDCLPNMDAQSVSERTVPLAKQLRKARPRTPILFVEDRTYQDAHANLGRARRNTENRVALRAAYDALVNQGVQGLAYVDGNALLGDDGEGTVDGSHPTDLGFMRQAGVMEPILRRLLR
jgi:hypothetical protein